MLRSAAIAALSKYIKFLLVFLAGGRYNTVTDPPVVVGGYGSLCLALVGVGTEGFSHATQNRRVVVVLLNRSTTSGRAFFNALVSMREEVTAL